MTLPYLIFAVLICIGLIFVRNKVIQNSLIILYLLFQISYTVYACFNYQNTELEYFTFDSIGILLLMTLSIISVPAIMHSYIYLSKRKEFGHLSSTYYASMVGLITAIGFGYLANHIAVTWIFTEITTLCASILIYHHRSKLALEATWKYVFICAISVTFIFIGILFLSLSLTHAGSDDLSFKNLLANSNQLNPFWLRLAFLFIFTGFTAKLGLVPMFTAGIDAKDKAPAPVSALMASVLMNLGFIGIFRFYVVVANTSINDWVNIVITIAAFLSLFVATVYMVKVKNLKRMFAYSGIEHMGLVMLGIVAGGIGYYAAILHIVLHAFVKSSLFFQYSQIYRVFKTKNIYQIGNYFKYNATGAMVLLLGFFSAAAMPPSGLFVSEFLIFRSLFEANQILILIAVLILLTMIIWAFGKNVMKILFIPVSNFDETNIPTIRSWESVSQFLLLAFSAYLGLNPPAEFVQLINDSIMLLPK